MLSIVFFLFLIDSLAHCHADHITSTGKLKTLVAGLKSAISVHSKAKADILLDEGDKVQFGSFSLLCLSTPGNFHE